MRFAMLTSASPVILQLQSPRKLSVLFNVLSNVNKSVSAGCGAVSVCLWHLCKMLQRHQMSLCSTKCLPCFSLANNSHFTLLYANFWKAFFAWLGSKNSTRAVIPEGGSTSLTTFPNGAKIFLSSSHGVLNGRFFTSMTVLLLLPDG